MFGSHLSIAGGMFKALLDAERLGFDTVQVFTKNQATSHPTTLPIGCWPVTFNGVKIG